MRSRHLIRAGVLRRWADSKPRYSYARVGNLTLTPSASGHGAERVLICLLFNHFDAMICIGRLRSYLCLPIPHDLRLGWNQPHSSLRDVPQFFIIPMRVHYSTRGKRSRS